MVLFKNGEVIQDQETTENPGRNKIFEDKKNDNIEHVAIEGTKYSAKDATIDELIEDIDMKDKNDREDTGKIDDSNNSSDSSSSRPSEYTH